MISTDVTQDIYVDGVKYTATLWSTKKALILGGEIAKVVGGPLGAVFENGMNAEITGQMLAKAFGSLFENLPPERLPVFAEQITQGVLILDDSGKLRHLNLDIDFRGKITHLLKLCSQILSYQYDFLSGLVGVIPASPAKQQANATIKVL